MYCDVVWSFFFLGVLSSRSISSLQVLRLSSTSRLLLVPLCSTLGPSPASLIRSMSAPSRSSSNWLRYPLKVLLTAPIIYIKIY